MIQRLRLDIPIPEGHGKKMYVWMYGIYTHQFRELDKWFGYRVGFD